MEELETKKVLRRNTINPDNLPQNLKDRYDEIQDLAEQLNDSEVSDDEKTEIQVKITAKDEALVRLVRRHVRVLEQEAAAAEKGDDGKGKKTEDQEKKGSGKMFKYL